MRALHVLKTSGIGGAERHLLILLPALVKLGVEVDLLVAETGDAARFVSAARDLGLEPSTVRAGPDLNPAFIRASLRAIDRFEPDLVHTHLVHGDLHGQIAARMRRVRGISSLHNAQAFYERLPYRPILRKASSLTTRTIAISRFVRDYAIELRLSDPSSCDVVHYGIEASGWKVPAQAVEEFRRSHRVGAGETVIGIGSRLIPGKGHELLIGAFARLTGSEGAVRLLIAGDGPHRSEVEGRVRAVGDPRIQVTGFVDEMTTFLAACDIVVQPTHPSLREGFGLTALEAMAAGKPVVVTDVGALPEVVVDGATGLVVGPDDVDGLARALARLTAERELRERFGAAGRQRAIDDFSVERMASGTLGAYEAALDSR